MSLYQGQKGFWAKRTMDSTPQFISVGGPNTPDSEVQKFATEWKNRKGYTGAQATNNVEWVDTSDYSDVNEASKKFYTDIASGNVEAYSGATNDPLEEDYLQNLLRQTEEEYSAQRQSTQTSYNTLVQQLKESRGLWDKDLEKTYGRTLEKANVNVYDRGVQDSGIKAKQTTEIGEDKSYQVEQRDLLEKQKQQIASQDLQERMASIARSEERAKFNVKNPYAGYQYS